MREFLLKELLGKRFKPGIFRKNVIGEITDTDSKEKKQTENQEPAYDFFAVKNRQIHEAPSYGEGFYYHIGKTAILCYSVRRKTKEEDLCQKFLI